MNVFTVAPEDAGALVACWQRDAAFMQAQPGFVSTQLHRGIGPSTTFLNYAVWESVVSFRAAFEHPEFRTKLADYPPSAISRPHLFRKEAVPGICQGV